MRLRWTHISRALLSDVNKDRMCAALWSAIVQHDGYLPGARAQARGRNVEVP